MGFWDTVREVLEKLSGGISPEEVENEKYDLKKNYEDFEKQELGKGIKYLKREAMQQESPARKMAARIILHELGEI
ncbi:hypothetical protein O3799_09535 [Fusobacterium periodonticum]|uniref:hypothetical protein n=1 Tax=Fusobacterium TaxID=848 RepID=UPI00352DD931